MTVVNPGVDLSSLARPAAVLKPPRRAFKRLLVPLLLIAGFAAVIFSSLGDVLRGAKEVTVTRPELASGGSGAAGPSSAPLVQAAGWIEPDPFPLEVVALTPGVVREVLALESAQVKKGDVVLRLVDDGEKIALASAEAVVAKAAADLTRAEVEARAARETFEAALGVTEADAAAKADVVGRAAEAARRSEAVVQGEAQVRIARAELELQRALAADGAAPAWAVDLAQAKLDEAIGGLASLKAEAALAAAEAEKAGAAATRTSRDKELRIDDRRARDAAAAGVAVARATLAEAEAARDAARLALDRTQVRAPADGVVLERLVGPGSTLSTDRPTALVLYDPASLRVRVDVAQPDIGKVAIGQRAEIRLEGRSDRVYAGEVFRVVKKADVIKVTVQAHVRVLEPDAFLKPEMLSQVRLFPLEGPSSRLGGGASSGGTRVLVPARLVTGGGVWTLDPLKPLARFKRVELGAAAGDKVEVLSGLNPSDKLIDEGREGLADGDRVRVKEGR
jgi:HlyD family secretion protein